MSHLAKMGDSTHVSETTMMNRTLCTLILLISLVALGLDSNAQETGISVTGLGTVEVQPNQVTLEITVQGGGESVVDALQTFRQKKQKLINEINEMDFPDVKLDFQGQSVSKGPSAEDAMNMFGPGEANDEPYQPYIISESVNLKMSYTGENIEDLIERASEVVEGVLDAGSQVGKTSQQAIYGGEYFSSILKASNTSLVDAEKEAMKKAFDDAKQKAQTIAEYAGVELGKVAAVMVDDLPFGFDEPDYTMGPYGMSTTEPLGKIKVRKSLSVNFHIK